MSWHDGPQDASDPTSTSASALLAWALVCAFAALALVLMVAGP